MNNFSHLVDEKDKFHNYYLEWYNTLIKNRYQYKVFLNDRCYRLALIYEDYTGNKMDESYSKYLTVNGLFLNIDQIVDYYNEENEFPSILINTDVIKYGEDINFFMADLTKKISDSMLKKYNKIISLNEIEYQLSGVISINSVITSNTQIVDQRYIGNISKKYIDRVGNSINESMSNNNIYSQFTNLLLPSYIFTETVELDESILDNNPNFIKSPSSFYKKNYTYMKYIIENDKIKSILTLRVVVIDKKINVAPLIIMHNLSDEETVLLINEIISHMQENNMNIEIIKWFRGLYNIDGKIGINQLLTLIFSNTIMQEFNKKYNVIVDEEDVDNKIEYISRNYNNLDSKTTKKYLKEIVTTEILTQSDLEIILNKHIYHTITIPNNLNNEAKTHKYLDNEIYECRYKQELVYKQISDMPYLITHRRSEIYKTTFDRLINKGFDYEYTIPHFLEMLDNGMLTITPWGGNTYNIVGFSQFIYYEHLALLIYPIKMHQISRVLGLIENEVFLHGGNYDKVKKYTKEYLKTINYNDNDIQEVLKYIDDISNLGTLEEWDVSLSAYMHGEFLKLLKENRHHQKEYQKFLSKKPYGELR